ncbi:MAG: S8 family serine peptidase [Acidobacteria bacterium]|nr:S8 family serine peptidase [Acidobacteriota bacterium]
MVARRLWLAFFWMAPALAQVVPDHYIVELAGSPAAASMSPLLEADAGVVSARRAEIRARQRTLRQELERREAEVLEQVDIVANALVVRLPDAKASLLASVPGVLRVHRVHEVRMLLDHALPLHKVPEAWAQAGGIDRAGAGVKIGIIDTGIDQSHPGFQDESLQVPEGFPRVNQDSDLGFTNRKIIVARSYGPLFNRRDQTPAQDHAGHGTAVAMTAAGVPNSGPRAVITGVAPRAYLGNYKITSGASTSSRDDVILKAIDDAVADGMDVINLSFGHVLASRPTDDILNGAIENASAAGVLVVVSAGNAGGDPNTITSPGTSNAAITVGASSNDRVFASSVAVDGLPLFLALPGTGPNSLDSISGPLADVATLDQSGLACQDLPAESLAGRIALIFRGECLFEIKLNNAQSAGARAALVYTDAARPDPVIMSVGRAALPASMVSHSDGLRIKEQLGSNPLLVATLQFTLGPFPVDPNRLAGFSSRGPNSDHAIKPDLVAVGTSIYTATQRVDRNSEEFDETGYVNFSGTSFSAPLVAGAAAVLKSARPGLTPEQYRSLLVNSAAPLLLGGSVAASPQQAGAGVLNLAAALENNVAASPSSLSLGAGSGAPDISRDLVLSNVGAVSDTFSISLVPQQGPAPAVSSGTVQIETGRSQTVAVRLSAAGLDPGEVRGFVWVQGSNSPTDARIPYWYAVPSTVPRFITILAAPSTGASSLPLREAIVFRISDASGLALADPQFTVTVASGGGEVLDVTSMDSEIPGAHGVTVRLGQGNNVFRIQAGSLQRDVPIQGDSTP